MKYSVSNIGWSKEDDGKMYSFLAENGFDGVEIAPTRLFSSPYEKREAGKLYGDMLKNKYNLTVPSMQSIWYGMSENIFNGPAERKILAQHTKKAVDFARAMGIGNIVFGCPKNRSFPPGIDKGEIMKIAKDFFAEIGDYAVKNGTVIAIEPNPEIYNTNFLNYTDRRREFVLDLGCDGVKLNFDLGTAVANNEDINKIKGYLNLVNHIHVSAPFLTPVKENKQLRELKTLLDNSKYDGFLSLEMKNTNNLADIQNTALFIGRFFSWNTGE
jgi:sugar phosphate isomerase/epimerase